MRNLFSDGPGFPQGGGINPLEEPTYNFAKLFQKPHEIERIWIPRGHAFLMPRLDLPTNSIIHKAASTRILAVPWLCLVQFLWNRKMSIGLKGLMRSFLPTVWWIYYYIAIHKPASHDFDWYNSWKSLKLWTGEQSLKNILACGRTHPVALWIVL